LFQGRVEFRDAADDKLTIDVVKRAATMKGLNDVIVKHALEVASEQSVLTIRVVRIDNEYYYELKHPS